MHLSPQHCQDCEANSIDDTEAPHTRKYVPDTTYNYYEAKDADNEDATNGRGTKNGDELFD